MSIAAVAVSTDSPWRRSEAEKLNVQIKVEKQEKVAF
jgi:hypothetical protein